MGSHKQLEGKHLIIHRYRNHRPHGRFIFQILRKEGAGAAASKYESRKRKKYEDIKGAFLPFILEAQGGFGIEAKRLVRELERRRKERE